MKRNFAVMAVLALALLVPGAALAQVQHGNGDNQQIQQEVNKKLHSHDSLKNVNATVEDGIVTLTGTVDRFIDKMNAEKRARSISNVAGIRDQIQVSSTAGNDQQLEQKLADKLRYDRISQGITFNSLNLKVNNGIVTVGGNVIDYPSRDSALAIVEDTPGVKGVVDDINVEPLSPMDDETRIAVARRIYGHPAMTKYAMDPQAPIRIVVNHGNVELDGVVDSQMDKQIAETQAKSANPIRS